MRACCTVPFFYSYTFPVSSFYHFIKINMLNRTHAPLRIGIFYEGNPLLHVSNYYTYCHYKRSRISLVGFQNFILQKLSEFENINTEKLVIAENHYFRGRINASEASERGPQLYNDRVFEDILMSMGVNTHYLPLRTLKGRNEEKGITTLLSLTAYRLAVAEKIDIAVFFFFDTEYIPLLQMINAIGVRTMLLKWDFEYINNDSTKVVTKMSHDLYQQASYKVDMIEEIEYGIANENPLIMDLFVTTVEETKERIENLAEEEQDRQTGKILNLIDNYGFIQYPNNNLFFYRGDVIGDFSDLKKHDTVEFELKPSENGLKATNVRKI